MKKQKLLLALLVALVGTTSLSAQQAIVIDPSYMTVPRYADLAAINTAIATPQQGMLVYNIATQSYWFRNAAAWTDLAAAVSGSQWTTAGSHIYNNNTGRIGIGIQPFYAGTNAKLNVLGEGFEGGIKAETTSIDHSAGYFQGSNTGIGISAMGGTGGYFNSTSPSGYALHTGNGKIGLNGFTKIGNDAAAPSIKTIKLTGTTPNSMNPNTWTFAAHGIADASKILSISVIVTDGSFQYLPHSSETGTLFTVNTAPNSGGSIAVGVKDVTKSVNVMGKPFKILIVYEE